MLQLLPKSDVFTPNTTNPQETVDCISSYIDKYHCETMCVDISFMNVIDACYVANACSTKHYMKYPSGNIQWYVSSGLVKEFNKPLELGNATYKF